MLIFEENHLAPLFGVLYSTVFVRMVFRFAEFAGHLDWFRFCSFVLS